jgi:hypothetical protein
MDLGDLERMTYSCLDGQGARVDGRAMVAAVCRSPSEERILIAPHPSFG